MEVLCVGMPRTGTESLQKALLTLGYDYTYHGWDVIFEEPNYSEQWARLARKKVSCVAFIHPIIMARACR